MNSPNTTFPPYVKILAVLLFLFGLFAFLRSLALWGEGCILYPPSGVDIAVTETDLVVNMPACLVAAYG